MATKNLVKNFTVETGGLYRAQINREAAKSFANSESGLKKAVDYFYAVLDKNKKHTPELAPAK